MESVTRWIFLAIAGVLAWIYIPKLFGGAKDGWQPIGVGRTETAEYAVGPGEPEKCTIQGKHFRGDFSSRGASLVDYYLTGDDRVKLTKTFRAGDGPYEIVTRATIENVSDTKRVHRLGVENTAWRTHAETDSHFGRQSPFATEVACAHDGGKLLRKSLSDFGPKDFEKPEIESGWFMQKRTIEFATTANAYFAQAIVPLEAPAPPACGLQVEERWYRDQFPDKTKDPSYGAMYRSRLIYPAKELGPHESATYEVGAYYGPKDRDLLAHAMGGQHQLSELINLGMFAVVSKVLVWFLIRVHDFIGNWGIAIIVLTLCVRVLLFPLTLKQIKSMVSMRRLKPEVDEINRKFKDDAQQKQVAMMEVYRKNGVNPFGGCLPVLVQMPVWWALYSVLQTAVELYHTPFLWFRLRSAGRHRGDELRAAEAHAATGRHGPAENDALLYAGAVYRHDAFPAVGPWYLHADELDTRHRSTASGRTIRAEGARHPGQRERHGGQEPIRQEGPAA